MPERPDPQASIVRAKQLHLLDRLANVRPHGRVTLTPVECRLLARWINDLLDVIDELADGA